MRDSFLALVVVAAVVLVSCGTGENKTCTLLGCSSDARVVTKATATADQMRAATVTACRNGACSQGTPAIVPSTTGDKEEMSLRGAATVQAYIELAAGGGYSIEARFPLDDTSPATNGDTYELDIGKAANGKDYGTITGKAQYTDTTPNGAGCPPICKNATIQ